MRPGLPSLGLPIWSIPEWCSILCRAFATCDGRGACVVYIHSRFCVEDGVEDRVIEAVHLRTQPEEALCDRV